MILLEANARPTVVRFSPRGNMLAAGLLDGSLHLWMIEQFGRPLGRAAMDDLVADILYSPRLSMLLTLGAERLRGWRIPDMGLAFELETGPARSATFLPDGNHALVGVEGRLRQFDLRDRSLVRETDALGSVITQLAIAGSRVVALCDGQVRLLDLETLAPTSTPQMSARAFTLSPRFDRIALVDGGVQVQPFPEATAVASFELPVCAFSPPLFTADGRLLVAATPEGAIDLWDMHHTKPVHSLEGHKGNVISLDLWHGHAKMASCGEDRTVRLWDLRR